MQKRNATVAVIGAGDYIGGEIAKKFAAEGFTVFAGRRDGAKLEPLVKEIEASGGSIVARTLDARKEDEVAAFLNDADAARAAGSLHLQCRRQRQFPDSGDHRPRVPKGLGNGLLGRLPGGARIGAADAAARPGQHLLHRRHRELARRQRFCRLCQRQIRPARGGAIDGARARAEKHPCRASDHRFRRRYRLGARAPRSSSGARKRSTIRIC